MSSEALNRFGKPSGGVHLLVCAAFACSLLNVLCGLYPLYAKDDGVVEGSGCVRLVSYSDLPLFQAVNAPIRKLYEEAGLCVELRYVPIQRAHGMQLQGRVDAQIGRSDAWLKDYGDEVVTLSSPLLRLDAMVAHSAGRDQGRLPANFDGRIVGLRPAVSWCTAWVKASGAIALPVQDFKDAGALLDSGRAEFLLYISFRQRPLPTLDTTFYRFDKVDEVVVYHVLAKDKAHLVPALDAALERLGGAAYFEQYLASHLQAGE